MQVVYEQANEARDKAAGVNLDEEAASLIRFQQSHRIGAFDKTANQLFDAIPDCKETSMKISTALSFERSLNTMQETSRKWLKPVNSWYGQGNRTAK